MIGVRGTFIEGATLVTRKGAHQYVQRGVLAGEIADEIPETWLELCNER